MDISFGFKIAVFDLDDTLWNGVSLYSDSKHILKTLKSHDIKLYIASFHTDARNCCRYLNIDHFFTDILYGTEKTKADMIKYVMEKNPTINEKEIVFFDDNADNIRLVKSKTNVKTVYISNGINWSHINDIIDLHFNWSIIDDDFHITDEARFAKATIKNISNVI